MRFSQIEPTELEARKVRAWGQLRKAPAPIDSINFLLACLIIIPGSIGIGDDLTSSEAPSFLAITFTLPSFTIVLSTLNLVVWHYRGRLSPLYAVAMAAVLLVAWVIEGVFILKDGIGGEEYADPAILACQAAFACLLMLSYLIYSIVAAAALIQTRHPVPSSLETSTASNGNAVGKLSTETGSSAA